MLELARALCRPLRPGRRCMAGLPGERRCGAGSVLVLRALLVRAPCRFFAIRQHHLVVLYFSNMRFAKARLQ